MQYSYPFTQNKSGTTILVLLALGIGVYFFIKWIKGRNPDDEETSTFEEDPIENENPSPNPEDPSGNKPDPYKWLKTGSKGKEVTELQTRLDKDIKLIYTLYGKKLNPVGTIDGKFGKKTKDALWNVKGVVETSLHQYDKLPLKDKWP